MPNAPKTFKSRGHTRSPRFADQTKSNTARGYGSDWRKVRQRYIAKHPLCEICEKEGRVTVTRQVHHIQPFRGLDDPLRLDESNLMSVCIPCHRKAEAKRRAV